MSCDYYYPRDDAGDFFEDRDEHEAAQMLRRIASLESKINRLLTGMNVALVQLNHLPVPVPKPVDDAITALSNAIDETD